MSVQAGCLMGRMVVVICFSLLKFGTCCSNWLVQGSYLSSSFCGLAELSEFKLRKISGGHLVLFHAQRKADIKAESLSKLD